MLDSRSRLTNQLPRILGCLAVLLWASAAQGGLYFKSITETEVSNGSPPPAMEVEGWIEGEKAKISFLETGGNPVIPEGSYLLTQDSGRSFLLVDPEKKTYSEWDLDAMLQMAGSMMNSLGPIMKFEVEEPNVEILSEEKGDPILGKSTRYYKIRTTYNMKMKVIGIKRNMETETLQELWTTTDIDDDAFGAWLRKEPPSTGNEELDKLIISEMDQTEGFALRSIIETRTVSGKKKKEDTSRSRTEVTELEERNIENDTFELPGDFQQTESPAAGGNSFKDMFKGQGR